MKEVNSKKIKVSLGDVLQKYSKDELATICSKITREICSKADELGQLFNSLHKTYPEVFGLIDFSLICTFTSGPFPADDPPFLCMLGTKEGIAKASQGIIASLKEIGNDKETA